MASDIILIVRRPDLGRQRPRRLGACPLRLRRPDRVGDPSGGVLRLQRRAQPDEDSPLAAAWDYPRSKLAAEQVLRDRHRDLPIVVLRIAGVYDDRCHSIPIAHEYAVARRRSAPPAEEAHPR
jgi:nucleoside-diphosphate-sugar epimerase